jgi:hypothetical protein
MRLYGLLTRVRRQGLEPRTRGLRGAAAAGYKLRRPISGRSGHVTLVRKAAENSGWWPSRPDPSRVRRGDSWILASATFSERLEVTVALDPGLRDLGALAEASAGG